MEEASSMITSISYNIQRQEAEKKARLSRENKISAKQQAKFKENDLKKKG
jgi:hypothetical protein